MKKKKMIIGIILIAVFSIITMIVTIVMFSSHKNVQSKPENIISKGAFAGMVKPAVSEEDKKQQNVSLNILQSITWESKDSYADVGIYNAKNCLYNLEVVIKSEDGEVIYNSPILKADEKIEEAMLTNKKIKAGAYNCTAEFIFYMPDTEEIFTKQLISNILVTIKE